ncbi:response regulator transcription factor [Pedobacter punctiformis]|uniref:Response regulator transcription factor n=1 Tax=Pedobacter punctiformis TaxID=3004097 RepID=A0ABT4LB15_9SPHI|nr:response regulator transcription factor [Pedobacter sp. HCMS5-2]MCZ4245110.1 response regulator transcription factor [Pedobacter sp. HCMS5-2]
MKEISIYIADDHAIVVDGLTEILKTQPWLKIMGTAGDGESLIDLMINRRVDVVVMDINMPRMNGIQCTEWIKKNYPATKVIILTMFPEKTYVDQLIKAGADGCLLKSRGSKDLLDAIERVMSSKSYFDTINDFMEPNHHPVYNLSEREVEIIKLIVNGLTSGEIADKLFISEHTVKTHRKNIFKKMGINSISQLTTFAINNKLLP